MPVLCQYYPLPSLPLILISFHHFTPDQTTLIVRTSRRRLFSRLLYFAVVLPQFITQVVNHHLEVLKVLSCLFFFSHLTPFLFQLLMLRKQYWFFHQFLFQFLVFFLHVLILQFHCLHSQRLWFFPVMVYFIIFADNLVAVTFFMSLRSLLCCEMGIDPNISHNAVLNVKFWAISFRNVPVVLNLIVWIFFINCPIWSLLDTLIHMVERFD